MHLEKQRLTYFLQVEQKGTLKRRAHVSICRSFTHLSESGHSLACGEFATLSTFGPGLGLKGPRRGPPPGAMGRKPPGSGGMPIIICCCCSCFFFFLPGIGPTMPPMAPYPYGIPMGGLIIIGVGYGLKPGILCPAMLKATPFTIEAGVVSVTGALFLSPFSSASPLFSFSPPSPSGAGGGGGGEG